ncbi:MAG TPA: cupin domain-containing protein [Pseudolabrys sp.]|jgi:quercetin dioxygenase-like cupin family protein
MSAQPAPRTPGATRAAPGEYVFDLGTVSKIMAGPGYSTAHGPCVEGDRIIVGLMRMKAGTGAEPHSHPNEQWVYVLEGTFHAKIGGKEFDVKPGSVIYIPANTIHSGGATPEGDVVFFTCKDGSHNLFGVKAT